MIEQWKTTIPELSGDEKRSVYVYLPESYRYDQSMRYPVLYMFDGHNVFFDSHATYGKSWGMGDYLDKTGTQMIVVAVECNHSPDHGRLKEYSPFDFTDPGLNLGVKKITGKGKTTMDWMVNTLKPLIDNKYRTLKGREYTYIAGSSMGGLMSLYAVLAYNEYFSKAAALSPSIWVGPAKLKKLMKETQLEQTEIFMDYGELEFANHDDMRTQFARFSADVIAAGIQATVRIVPGGTHCEACWEKEIPFFMSVLVNEA